jgi:tetratricopeptide (TPR) repeat protein
MSSNEQRQDSGATYTGQRLHYSSKLMNAFNTFNLGMVTEVTHPLKAKYGEAYDYLIAGDTFRYQEALDSAINAYGTALTLRPDLMEAHIGLAQCYRRQGKSMNAIPHLQEVLRQNAFQKELHLDIAKCYTECGYLSQAIHHYHCVLKLDKRSIDAHFGLALVVEVQEDWVEAIHLYQEILRIEPEFLPAYNNLGSLYLRTGEYKLAEALFRQLIVKAPDFNRAYLGLALTLDRSGQRLLALNAYHHVMVARPNSRNTQFIQQRIVQLNKELGRSKANKHTTLIRIK